MLEALKIRWLAWLSGDRDAPALTPDQLALLYPDEDPKPTNIRQIVFD